MTYICPGIGLIALLIALLLWCLRRNSCRHDILLRNVAAATNAHAVRVSAYTPGAQIINASVSSGWMQTTNYPTSVLWKPAGGGPIPSGNPLPGTFSIWVQNNAQPDKRVVIEWLSKDGKDIICKQLLRVGCGEKLEGPPKEEEPVDVGTSSHCRCLSAETDSDEDSNQYAEPDLSVDVGTPVQTAYLEVEVPYTIEVEPPSLQFTRQWDVSVLDALGDEQPVTVPVSDNLTGLATFTLPYPGSYTFYLTVTDPATCVSATDRDEDDYTDTDFTTFKMKAAATKIKYEVDLCDPLKYNFANDSDPGVSVDKWTVTQPPSQTPIKTQTGGNSFTYTFPTLGVTYMVCLKTSDGTACISIMPASTQDKPLFRWDYSSCPENHFLVQFYNDSEVSNCPVTWKWDFDDANSGANNTSNLEEPSHTFADPGTYTVTLDVTTQGTSPQTFSTSEFIHVYHWKPDFTFNVCGDGNVIYETSVDDPSWTFPDGSPGTSDKKKVSVCYKSKGVYEAKLFAVNKDFGYCETTKEVTLTNITRCCPHDKIVERHEFNYGGKTYRLVTRLRCYGFPHPVVFAKSKLQKKTSYGWVRWWAHHIKVDLGGHLYTPVIGGCRCQVPHQVWGSKARSKYWARVAKRFAPPLILQTRMREGSVWSTHHVKVDSNDPGRDFTLSLWVNDCGCN